MYEYKAQFVRVIDGDTVTLEIDLGLHVRKVETVRLYGINTPELHAKDEAERALAVKARDYVENALGMATAIVARTLKPYETDKYGRFLADVYYQSLGETMLCPLNKELLDLGLAEVYVP